MPPLLFILSFIFPPSCLGASGAMPPLDQALIEYTEGRYEAALELAEGASKNSAPAAGASLLRGHALRKLRRHGDAAAAFQQALEADPQSFDAGLHLGLAFFESGQWSRAQDAFEKCAKAWPEKPEPLLGLGLLQQSRKLWEESRRSFERALALDRANPGAWSSLADSLIELGRLREAAKAREKALHLSPKKDPELSFSQACLWYALGDFEMSEKALMESEAGATPEAFYLQGCLEFRKGELEKAERLFQAALDARPGYPEAELNLGIVLYNQGDDAAAAGRFESLLRRHPRHRAAADYLQAARGMAYDRLMRRGSQAVVGNEPALALAQWEKALAFAPDPALVRRMIKSLRSVSGPLAAPERDLGAEALAKAAALRKDRVALHEKAAEDLILQGNSREAMAEFESALLIDPQNPRLQAKQRQARSQLRRAVSGLLARAVEWEAGKKAKEALESAEAALALDPDDLEAGRMAKRLAAALKVTREDPALANSLYYEGAYRYGAGDTALALELWRRGQKASPRHPQIRQAILAAQTKLKSLAELQGRR